jgi:hypothetical protein
LKDLRKLQGDINKAVFQRYDWLNIDPATGFHEVGYLPDEKNVRFTVGEESRLEVLRRLSKLNRARFEEQLQSGATSKSAIADASLDDDLFAMGGGKS